MRCSATSRFVVQDRRPQKGSKRQLSPEHQVKEGKKAKDAPGAQPPAQVHRLKYVFQLHVKQLTFVLACGRQQLSRPLQPSLPMQSQATLKKR